MKKTLLMNAIVVILLPVVFLMITSLKTMNENTGVLKIVQTGGPCSYNTFSGIATIISVKDAPKNGYNVYENSVEIKYNFTPDDPKAIKNYKFTNWKDTDIRFFIGSGENPPRGCAEKQGLIEGSKHKCIREEIVKGTCTPVVFVFPNFNQDDCFKK